MGKPQRFSRSAQDILDNKIMQFLCQMFKTYRLEVCSRFYFQLSILERSNETSLMHLLIGKRSTDEITHHTDLVARVSACVVPWNPTGTPGLPPLSHSGCIRDSEVPWPPLKGSRATQQQASLHRLPGTLTGPKDGSTTCYLVLFNVTSWNFHYSVLHDATSKRYVIGGKNNGLCCC